ncbi:hypothetical protein Efla_000104 [Eimeria flavescens]
MARSKLLFFRFFSPAFSSLFKWLTKPPAAVSSMHACKGGPPEAGKGAPLLRLGPPAAVYTSHCSRQHRSRLLQQRTLDRTRRRQSAVFSASPWGSRSIQPVGISVLLQRSEGQQHCRLKSGSAAPSADMEGGWKALFRGWEVHAKGRKTRGGGTS